MWNPIISLGEESHMGPQHHPIQLKGRLTYMGHYGLKCMFSMSETW